MSEAAAARLFPGEVLIEKGDAKASARQLLGAHCARGTTADDRDLAHRLGCWLLVI
jgi:hypothetical protein